MKKIKLITYISAFVSSFSGVLIVTSSYYGFSIVNIVIGSFFILLGIYVIKRLKVLMGLSEYLQKDVLENKNKDEVKSFFTHEFVFQIVFFLFSLLIFSGVYHRIFVEHFSVFG